MIRPEDLQDRAIYRAPIDRQEPEAVADEDESDRSTPDEPCHPGQPAAVEHGERTGGDPGHGEEA
jgi:hypothetical protein